MLCDECTKRVIPPFGAPGRCSGCGALVANWQQRFCDNCSEELRQCKLCGIKVHTNSAKEVETLIPRGQLFLRLDESKKGSFEEVRQGTRVVVTLPALGYWRTWQFASINTSIIKLERLIDKSQRSYWDNSGGGEILAILQTVNNTKEPILVELVEAEKDSWWRRGGQVPNGKRFSFYLRVVP